MITKAALEHRPKGNYAYATDCDTLHIRIRTAKNEVNQVTLRIGDPYDWAKGGTGGNLNAENAYGWIGGENTPMEKVATTARFDYWETTAKPTYKRSRYAFIIEGKEETLLFGEKKIVTLEASNREKALSDIVNFFCFPYIHASDVFQAPSWVKDAIFYQIFPERFDNGDPSISPDSALEWGSQDPHYDSFFGGDLQGIINRLDYIKDLGITAIYLCPVAEGASNHKYDTTDYMKVDPHFGDAATFKRLVDEAHRRGIRIMLDAVFNHTGFHAKQWQDVLKHQEKSKYKDWFHIRSFPVLSKPVEKIRSKDDIHYETFGFTPYMPKLNTENPEVRDYLLEVGRYWIETFDIDGWRLDVANEVDHTFWRAFRAAVKAIKPDVYILGEVWHDAMPWLQGDQFDAVMNYPLSEAVIALMATQDMDVMTFIEQVYDNRMLYPRPVTESTFNLLDSHDTPRILTKCGEDTNKVKLAYTFLYTQPGVPCIYYGSEVGMTGDHDPLCRKCMVWDQADHDLDLFAFMKRIIAIRKTEPATKAVQMQFLQVDPSHQVLAYEKGTENERLIVVMNVTKTPIEVTMPILKGTELLSEKAFDWRKSKGHITLAPYDCMILKA